MIASEIGDTGLISSMNYPFAGYEQYFSTHLYNLTENKTVKFEVLNCTKSTEFIICEINRNNSWNKT